MNTLNPKKINIIYNLPPKLSKKDRVAIDSEWFEMNVKTKAHRPHGIFACATFCIDDKTVYIVTDVNDLAQAFANIDPAVHIYANAKFDIIQLRKYVKIPQRKRLWDVILIEKVMYSGYYNNFSLADLARRRLNLFLPKDERLEFGGEIKEMTKEMIQYAAMDAVATWMVYQDQRSEICDVDLDVWKNIDLPYLWCVLGMSGIKLDVPAWLELAEQNKIIVEETKAKYKSINLNSPAQVKAELKRLGYKRIEDTSEETLDSIKDDCPFAGEVLEYRKIARLTSTYGKKFVNDWVEEDGRIYADLSPNGTKTSRSSCRNPNLQNQPNDKRYRKCYVAGEDNVFAIADYGAQEPRLAAYLSQDKDLIAVFNSGKDIYLTIAKEVFGKVIKKSDPDYKQERNKIKSLILGIFYGMTAYGLSWRLGVEKDEAQHMIDRIFEVYPGVKDYVTRQLESGDYTVSLSGRKIWLNKYQYSWEREVLNFPIQTSAAEMKKIGAYRVLSKWCGKDFYMDTPFVLDVHDELVFEIHESGAEAMRTLLEEDLKAVAEEIHLGIPGVIDVEIGKSWADKDSKKKIEEPQVSIGR